MLITTNIGSSVRSLYFWANGLTTEFGSFRNLGCVPFGAKHRQLANPIFCLSPAGNFEGTSTAGADVSTYRSESESRSPVFIRHWFVICRRLYIYRFLPEPVRRLWQYSFDSICLLRRLAVKEPPGSLVVRFRLNVTVHFLRIVRF